ncbi:hypothetical protein OHB14_52845 [Streptomyces sp. NBC_01613]
MRTLTGVRRQSASDGHHVRLALREVHLEPDPGGFGAFTVMTVTAHLP